MQQPLPTGVPPLTAPRFYVTGRQPLNPGAILLAIVAASIALSAVLYALRQNGHTHLASANPSADRSPNATSASTPDDDNDPNQIDTIVLGDPADAPVPAKRGDHVSPVHPFVIVHLSRFGEQVGLIPDSPAGHLLYNWLAAFNHASYPELANALPNEELSEAAAAQMELRRETGGFNLLSAKEVSPDILVFRLRDQTPEANEVLGTLQVRANSNPAAIATFSLRAVPQARKAAAKTDTTAPTVRPPQ
ncbi:MAG: hypothetical protein JSS95_09465 [Acidobacteria bacterium]|nr:hypothetical protein [Acidobacteriota bacterium]